MTDNDHNQQAPLDVAAIRARAEAATRGPWNDVRVGRPGNGHGGSREEQICNDEGVGVAILMSDGSAEAVVNTIFIAHSRTDVPVLCDEVERERKVSDAWRALALARFSPAQAGIYDHKTEQQHRRALAALRALGIDPEVA